MSLSSSSAPVPETLVRALIVVDLQNDFMPGGALGVPDGDAVVEPANRLMKRFEFVVATRDWHPPGHGSFASRHPGHKPGDTIDLHGVDQVLWPDHCIENTSGAMFQAGLDQSRLRKVFHKGTDPRVDSYSCFFDNARRRDTGLADYLRENDVREVYLLGLATDYCVKFSALDGVESGFAMRVIEDGCRGIDLTPGDVARSLDQMRDAGVRIVTSAEL